MCAKIIGELRKFVAPEFVFGVGARFQVGRYARNLGAHRILVVTDPGVTEAGWPKDITISLEEEELEYTVFSEVTPNPRDHEVMKGVMKYKEADCDSIVVVGGGSPIDCAKGIGIVAANGGNILSYEGVDTIPEPGPPLICIPTTAGTSADVSQFAIIKDTQNLNKIAIISKAIVPDVSLIDPETTTTMDPFLSACTGLDALTHGIEAMVSNASSPITDLHALKSIELASENIEKVIASPLDLVVRENMMLASLEAGLAFSNASLGATHAMAHSLGGMLDLPHGECNAILLSHVTVFNFSSAVAKFQQIAAAMSIDTRGMALGEIKTAIFKRIEQLRQNLGVLRHLGDVGVRTGDVPELADKAVVDPCLVTNPRQANKKDIEIIFEEAI